MPLKRVITELRTLLHSFFCPSHTPTRGQLHLQNKHKRLRTNFNLLKALSVGHLIHHCGRKGGQKKSSWTRPCMVESCCAVEQLIGNLFPEFATCTSLHSHLSLNNIFSLLLDSRVTVWFLKSDGALARHSSQFTLSC